MSTWHNKTEHCSTVCHVQPPSVESRLPEFQEALMFASEFQEVLMFASEKTPDNVMTSQSLTAVSLVVVFLSTIKHQNLSCYFIDLVCVHVQNFLHKIPLYRWSDSERAHPKHFRFACSAWTLDNLLTQQEKPNLRHFFFESEHALTVGYSSQLVYMAAADPC